MTKIHYWIDWQINPRDKAEARKGACGYFGETTEDKEKVTCKICKRILSIEPTVKRIGKDRYEFRSMDGTSKYDEKTAKRLLAAMDPNYDFECVKSNPGQAFCL